MSDRARELLEAALDHLHGMNSYEDCLLKNRIRAYLAEPEVKRDDEPVAWIREVDIDNPVSALVRTQHECGDCNIPLYLHPEPKVPFVRLTDEEKNVLFNRVVMEGITMMQFVDAVENQLEEKNR